MTTMTVHDGRRLGRLLHELEEEAETLELAGLEERAARCRREAATVRTRLDGARQARQEQEARERAERRQQESARAEREAETEARRKRAHTFLAELFQGAIHMPVADVTTAAAVAGIADGDLLHAAGELGLRTFGHLKSGTATLPDRSKPLMWGRALPFGALLDCGPAVLG